MENCTFKKTKEGLQLRGILSLCLGKLRRWEGGGRGGCNRDREREVWSASLRSRGAKSGLESRCLPPILSFSYTSCLGKQKAPPLPTSRIPTCGCDDPQDTSVSFHRGTLTTLNWLVYSLGAGSGGPEDPMLLWPGAGANRLRVHRQSWGDCPGDPSRATLAWVSLNSVPA